jgi:hypothetical protein
MVADHRTLPVVAPAGTEGVSKVPSCEPRVRRLRRNEDDALLFIDLGSWNCGTGALMTDDERHAVSDELFRYRNGLLRVTEVVGYDSD